MTKVLDRVSEEIIDFCPACGSVIVFGQKAWRVGHELVCPQVDCLLKRARATIVVAGREGGQR